VVQSDERVRSCGSSAVRAGDDVAASVALGRDEPAIVDPVHGFAETAEVREMENCYAEGKTVRNWGWQSRDDALGPLQRRAFSI
jgi:hypothetical protein